MTQINQLTALDTVSGGDQFPVFSGTNGDTRRTSATALAAFVNAQATAAGSMLQQFASPNASGFNVQITPTSASVWLVLTPLAGYAAGTVTFPDAAYLTDGQEIMVSCTQTVTTLTVSGSGVTVNGAPASTGVSTPFRLKYSAANASWYRVN